MTKGYEYAPTTAERKLLEVMLNPDNFALSDTKLCQLAGVSRNTFYKSMKKPGFVDYYNELSMNALRGKVGNILQASAVYALSPEGFQDRKMLLTMTGLYADKQETKLSGAVETTNPLEGLTRDEVRKLIGDG